MRFLFKMVFNSVHDRVIEHAAQFQASNLVTWFLGFTSKSSQPVLFDMLKEVPKFGLSSDMSYVAPARRANNMNSIILCIASTALDSLIHTPHRTCCLDSIYLPTYAASDSRPASPMK
jgi:hypothetical protein